MDPITLALLGGGVGVVKSLVEGGQADAERKRQAELLRISPWTGIRPNMDAKDPNVIGNVLSGAVGGGMLGKSIADADEAGGWLSMLSGGDGAPVEAPVFQPQASLGVDTNLGRWELLKKHPWLAAR